MTKLSAVLALTISALFLAALVNADTKDYSSSLLRGGDRDKEVDTDLEGDGPDVWCAMTWLNFDGCKIARKRGANCLWCVTSINTRYCAWKGRADTYIWDCRNPKKWEKEEGASLEEEEHLLLTVEQAEDINHNKDPEDKEAPTEEVSLLKKGSFLDVNYKCYNYKKGNQCKGNKGCTWCNYKDKKWCSPEGAPETDPRLGPTCSGGSSAVVTTTE